MSRLPTTADRLIERNTRAHTVDGYTSHYALAAAHEATIKVLCADLDTLSGRNAICPPGCHQAEMALGAARVLVEYEQTDEVPGTRYEPREPATATVLRVFINGAWCNAQDVVPDGIVRDWESLILEGGSDDVAEEARGAFLSICPVPTFPRVAA